MTEPFAIHVLDTAENPWRRDVLPSFTVEYEEEPEERYSPTQPRKKGKFAPAGPKLETGTLPGPPGVGEPFAMYAYKLQGKYGTVEVAPSATPAQVGEVRRVIDFVDQHTGAADPASVAYSVEKVTSEIRDRPYEQSVAIMPDGATVYGPRGDATSSVISAYAGDQAAVLLHNHPSSMGPSPSDLWVTGRPSATVRDVRVTSPKYDYRITAPRSGWGDNDTFMAAAYKAHGPTKQAYDRGGDEASVSDAFWGAVAPKMGWSYTRTPR